MSTMTEIDVSYTEHGCKVTHKVQTDPRGRVDEEIILEGDPVNYNIPPGIVKLIDGAAW